PQGRPWQEPDDDWDSSGRTDLHTAIDSGGRNTDARSGVGEACGDWDVIRARATELGAAALGPGRAHAGVRAAARARGRGAAGAGAERALALAAPTGDGLAAGAGLADRIRADVVGEAVTYVVNRNINFSNICYTGCRFCAFAQRKGDADAFSLSSAKVADRAFEAHLAGATDARMQGGIDPDPPL